MLDVKESGVDIHLGDKCSKIAFEWAQKTFPNRRHRIGMPDTRLKGSYANVLDYGDLRLAIASDGIGTKIEVAERTGIYNSLGFDLVSMVVDDLACIGAEPVNFSNILDVDYLDEKVVDSLMEGLYEASNVASIAVTGGEIAELGSRISGYGSGMHFNWCATGIGALAKNKNPIDGSTIKPGDSIIAIKSLGFRSNGFTMARKILEAAFGDKWHEEISHSGIPWGQILLIPSLICSPAIMKLHAEDVDIHGTVHVTGGGIAGNLSRMLRKNKVGAELNNLFEPHSFMTELQELGNIDEEQVYELWNMGNAMLVIVESGDEERALDIIRMNQYQGRVAGVVTADETIVLHSKSVKPTTLIYEVH
ncbi:MAG: phosphoribosylformylglycinamidine cyclo-ligase [Chlamydiales bacterium]|jgi:phosphoribosylformylglycinamidine cyclo-ligase